MKVLITGVTGFVGPYLVQEFIQEDPTCELWGTYQPGNLAATWADTLAAAHPGLVEKLRLLEYDLAAGNGGDKLVELQPDVVIHLAAQSSVGRSWQNKEQTLETNVIGTVRLLELLRQCDRVPRVLLIGSAEEYGLVRPAETPVTEDNQVRPLSPYGVSKLAAGLLGQQFHRAYGLPVIGVRAFNHIGPGQALGFVTSDFAKQVADIEKGVLEPVLRVGNLEALRDFTDVRDVVRAYRLLALAGTPGEMYNVASGKGVPVSLILRILLSLAKVSIRVEEDPARLRPSDVPVMVGSFEKLNKAVGWQPEIGLEQSLKDILEFWREG